jgi:hypothetical protein
MIELKTILYYIYLYHYGRNVPLRPRDAPRERHGGNPSAATPSYPSPSLPFPRRRRRARSDEARAASAATRFLLLPAWSRGGAGRPSMAGARAPWWSPAAGMSRSGGDDVAGRWWYGAATTTAASGLWGKMVCGCGQGGRAASSSACSMSIWRRARPGAWRPAAGWRRGDARAAGRRNGGSLALLAQIWARAGGQR